MGYLSAAARFTGAASLALALGVGGCALGDSAAAPARFDPGGVKIGIKSVSNGFTEPTFITSPRDGSGRMFVVEKPGLVRTFNKKVFLDIRSRVGSSNQEQVLLGLAFDPKFRKNGRL